MFRDTMLQYININWGKLNELTSTLGINREEVESILANRASSNEQGCLTAGPVMYTSTYYGTISIKDF